MFGHVLRVTGTTVVTVVAFVTPVLATAAALPAPADTVIDGCTIVSNPTPTHFSNCPGADFGDSNLSGLNLSFANLSGSPFVQCQVMVGCSAAELANANLTQANLTNVSVADATVISHDPFPVTS